MFSGPHPLRLQSLQFVPESSVPLIQTTAEEANSMSLLWEDVLDVLDDDVEANVDTDRSSSNEDPLSSSSSSYPSSRNHMYRLGIFQPAILLQIVQGIIQRLFQSVVLLHQHTWLSLSPNIRARSSILVQRVITTAYLQASHTESVHAVPLTWRELLFWHATLGLALIGLAVHFHTFVVVSSVGAFHFGAPFVAVGAYPLVSDAVRCTVVWESVSFVGVLLLAMILWGIGRAFIMIWGSLLRVSNWCIANTPHIVVDWVDTTMQANTATQQGSFVAAATAVVWRPVAWFTWFIERVVHGHAAQREELREDPRWVWMLAHAGD